MNIGIVCCVLVVALLQVSDANDEHKLIKDLLTGYQDQRYQLARPVFNLDDTVVVKFGLALLRSQFDKETRTLTADVWLKYQWRDKYLQWDPEVYGRLDLMHILPGDIGNENIWQPDIVPYNFKMDVERFAMAVVFKDGGVSHIPPATITVKCEENSKKQFVCPMKFGSWTFDGFKLDIDFYDNVEGVDINDYIADDRFKLVDQSAKKSVIYYPCCAEPYPNLQFNLTFVEKKDSWFG